MTESAEKQPTVPRINLELPADLEATYANLTLISQSPSEIIIDFAGLMPNVPKTKIRSRIVMTPLNAKLLHRALTDALLKFESRYGVINIPENVVIDPNKGFVK